MREITKWMTWFCPDRCPTAISAWVPGTPMTSPFAERLVNGVNGVKP